MAEPRYHASPDGSSPRARGTLQQYADSSHRSRFIPACAGNARPSWGRWCLTTVHPRVRGERLFLDSYNSSGFGSSPRARGTPAVERLVPVPRRFIPACAGNARIVGRESDGSAVHPRVRGERAGAKDLSPAGSGSSPRARGTHPPRPVRSGASRFIPACAGNADIRLP